MNLQKTFIKDLLILEPKIFYDERGYFCETYNFDVLKENNINVNFVQDNESCSSYAVLRGLHFQAKQYAQAKLVRVVLGNILDVAVDIRRDSESFGKYFAIEISAENKKQLFIPRGFAHGFIVLSRQAIVNYKCDNYYNRDSCMGINYQDKTLNIDWKLKNTEFIINERDKNFPNLEQIKNLL